MKPWMMAHPWMTFFVVTGAISAVVTLVRGRETYKFGDGSSFTAGSVPLVGGELAVRGDANQARWRE